MPARKGNKNAVGNSGGKSLQDRELAAAVRSLALTEIKNILDTKKMTQLKQQVILRLAGSVLPRLNEHTGEGGEPVQVSVISFKPQCPSPQKNTSAPSVHIS